MDLSDPDISEVIVTARIKITHAIAPLSELWLTQFDEN